MKSVAYIGGFVVGVVFVAMVSVLLSKKYKTLRKYDERQTLVQKTGYMWGFYTAILLILLRELLAEFFDILILSEYISAVMIVLVSLSVHLGYCIFHDAYVSLTDNPKRIVRMLMILGGMNIFLSFMVISHEGALNLLIGLFSILLALMVAVRQFMLKKQI